MDISSGFELCPALPVEEPTVWRLRISGMEIYFLANEERALVSVQMTDGSRHYAESAINPAPIASTGRGAREKESGGRSPALILAW
jgi:hypothetical protein